VTDHVWNRILAERAWGRWPAEDVVRAVARLRRAGLRVLEVGCGAGAQLWYLDHEGHRPVGLDVAPAGLDQARTRLADEGAKVPLVRGDARALPFAGRSFDLVLDVETFAHVPAGGAAPAWAEAARVLVPGGRLLTIGFTASTTGAGSGTAIDEHSVRDLTVGPLADLGTISFLDDARVDALASVTGLTLEDVQRRSRTVGPEHELIEELVVVARR
jgi:ubiquinone/menaquinone biosynthesis C-methylase UbiE